jgi:hypothetical protein
MCEQLKQCCGARTAKNRIVFLAGAGAAPKLFILDSLSNLKGVGAEPEPNHFPSQNRSRVSIKMRPLRKNDYKYYYIFSSTNPSKI